MMDLPIELRNKIIDFLASLPNLHDSDTQQALLYQAGLDFQLSSQIPYGKPIAEFVPRLVGVLTKFGKLNDGRNALEAVLEAAKSQIGADRREHCDRLIGELQVFCKNSAGQNEPLLPKSAKKPSPVMANPFGDRGASLIRNAFLIGKKCCGKFWKRYTKGTAWC
jgi:hypothetical protein